VAEVEFDQAGCEDDSQSSLWFFNCQIYVSDDPYFHLTQRPLEQYEALKVYSYTRYAAGSLFEDQRLAAISL